MRPKQNRTPKGQDGREGGTHRANGGHEDGAVRVGLLPRLADALGASIDRLLVDGADVIHYDPQLYQSADVMVE